MGKKEQIEAIKLDIDVFENSNLLYFASDTRKTQMQIVLSEENRQAIINSLKQQLKDLEKENDND